MNQDQTPVKANPLALLPILIFLAIFIGAGVAFQDFYAAPAIVAFLIALACAFALNARYSFQEKIHIIAQGLADDNIITMCLIFLTAGALSGIVSAAGGVDSTVALALALVPGRLAVVGLFLIGCFISTAMGTSVGTIVALTPIAVGIAQQTGFSTALCTAAVVCGAMFGDNLSMISDTTIAAVRTQGCEMKDKFKMNFFIVLPAALITAAIFFILTTGYDVALESLSYNALHVVPYLLVLVGALMGLNIFLVLIAGILSSAIIGLATGTLALSQILSVMGTGVNSMYDITVISIVVCCIGSLVKAGGGIQWTLEKVRAAAKSRKGAQIGIAALVAGIDVATANNTIAIVMAGSLAKDISQEYGIEPRRTASLLDIFASVVQGLLPYGAQLLYASEASGLTSLDIIPYLYYPVLMALSALIFILVIPERRQAR